MKNTAIVAFVPVIHKGYLDFLSTHEGDIYLFGSEIIEKFVHLTRDLRVIDPKVMATILKAVLPKRKIDILSFNDLSSWKYDLTVMPDDEVCRDVVEKYLKGNKVKFVTVFLRWNKAITFKENDIDPNRVITEEQCHRDVMGEASKEATKSSDWWRQIGAIAVKDKKILLRANNHHLPTDFHLATNGDPRSNFDAGQHQDIYTSIHAEAEIVALAANQGTSLKGVSLYVTTFPCPNCARLICAAGIKKVFYSKGYSLMDAQKILDHFGVEVVLVQ